MQRILLITPLIGNNGITEVLSAITAHLQEYTWDLAAHFAEGQRTLEVNGQTFCLPPQEKLGAYTQAIRRIVKAGSYDAVYVHANSAMMLVETLAARSGGAKKIVTHCHCSSSRYKPLHYLAKPIFSAAPVTKVACSRMAADWSYFGKKIIIPNGIDVANFSFQAKKRAAARAELGASEDAILIGNFGRLSYEKNQLFLLEIFAAFYQNHPEARLLLIDDPEAHAQVVSAIESKSLSSVVQILEPRPNLAELYHALDLMIMPSRFEGLSLVALEAQANGLPLLICDHLTEETYATEYARPISLKKGAVDWAKEAERALQTLPRGKDTSAPLAEAHLTQEEMLASISEVLSGRNKAQDMQRHGGGRKI